jgi:hypothetical protein
MFLLDKRRSQQKGTIERNYMMKSGFQVITHNGQPVGAGQGNGGKRLGYCVGGVIVSIIPGYLEAVLAQERAALVAAQSRTVTDEAEVSAKPSRRTRIAYWELEELKNDPDCRGDGFCPHCKTTLAYFDKRCVDTDAGERDVYQCWSCDRFFRPPR